MERWQSLAECAALEMRYGLTTIGGSNPSLSANLRPIRGLRLTGDISVIQEY